MRKFWKFLRHLYSFSSLFFVQSWDIHTCNQFKDLFLFIVVNQNFSVTLFRIENIKAVTFWIIEVGLRVKGLICKVRRRIQWFRTLFTILSIRLFMRNFSIILCGLWLLLLSFHWMKSLPILTMRIFLEIININKY